MSHAVFDLWVPEPVASHGNQLLGPQIDEVGNFARRHDDSTSEC